MKKSREQFLPAVRKILEAMKNNNQGEELFIERASALEAEFIVYENLLTERTELKVQRIQISENLSKAEDSLIEKMKSINVFIQSLISTKDGKYREFVQTGKFTSLISSSMGVILDGAKYFLNGLKKNLSMGIPEKYAIELEALINDFESVFKESQLIKQKETNAILKLKEKEDDFLSIFKKTVSFIKSQINSSEYHVYFD
ncbi:hypothetical protein JXR93_08535 [bacterium]|nr:hypothetical protein [bacterium]